MPDIVKKYLDKIKEFWNKYNKKQKTIFISSVLVAVIAIAILGFVLAQPCLLYTSPSPRDCS